MVWVFNKEFRNFEKTISALIKKMKESKTFEQKYGEKLEGEELKGYDVDGRKPEEIYICDTFDISFFITTPQFFRVTDKSGKEIIKMDCQYDLYDEWARIRSNRFAVLLRYAREQDDARKDKSEKFKKASGQAKAKIATRHMENTKKEVTYAQMFDRLKEL